MKVFQRTIPIIACIASLFASAVTMAHDLPTSVTIQLFVKPESERLLVLARVPMEALSEVQIPLRGPGFIALETAGPALDEAARMYLVENMRFFANGDDLGRAALERTRVATSGDKSFAEFASAYERLTSPAPQSTESIYWKQAFLDVAMTLPLESPQARFAFEADLERIGLITQIVLRFVPPGSPERAFSYVGNPGLIQLEPSWWYAFSRFVVLGFEHILEGIDHLLFLLCLVIPARSVRALIPVITAFTVAHSITLISSAFGFTPTAMWFPALIETLIALSVFYMACENMLGVKLERRWLLVFAFGLIHGFGFSFILADRMQFAGSHLVSALLAFNIGVELGQLLVLMIAVPLIALLFKLIKNERFGVLLLSALAAHSAWHWMTERGSGLLEYRWEWPTLDAAFFAAALRWGMLAVASAGVLWAMHLVLARFTRKHQVGSN